MSEITGNSNNENVTQQSSEQAGVNSDRVYRVAREYAAQGRGYIGTAGSRVAHFVEEEPWIAVACAFVAGYAIAQVVKRMS